MVYPQSLLLHIRPRSEVDLNRSLWYISLVHGMQVANSSEVDLNRSLWYTVFPIATPLDLVLKLTSTGHYGIV